MEIENSLKPLFCNALQLVTNRDQGKVWHFRVKLRIWTTPGLGSRRHKKSIGSLAAVLDQSAGCGPGVCGLWTTLAID